MDDSCLDVPRIVEVSDGMKEVEKSVTGRCIARPTQLLPSNARNSATISNSYQS